MAIDADIRDQAYQFFIQEAPELLQVIEEDLLTLREERSTAKIHNMMRAAHSIKGGAASVGLDTIKTLAHSVEDIFKGLHNEELKIDAEVENLLLQVYDCLRFPLMEQINTGQFDSDQAMANAEPVFAQIEAQIGEFLKGGGDLPSSIELGVDIALSIFDVDVTQGLERLGGVLANPQGEEVAGELRAQAEVFSGIAELLNLPGFGAIASSAIAALDANPKCAVQITQLALADFQAAQQAVIAGDRTQGGAPSAALAELATPKAAGETFPPSPSHPLTPSPALFASVDDLFGDFNLSVEPAALEQKLVEQIFDGEIVEQAKASPVADAENISIPSLDDLFGDFSLSAEPANKEISPPLPLSPSNTQDTSQELLQSVEDIFGSLPPIEASSTSTDNSAAIVPAPVNLPTVQQKGSIVPAPVNLPTVQQKGDISAPANLPTTSQKAAITSAPAKVPTASQKSEGTAASSAPTAQLSVRVDLERLERMNNLVGELAINRNSLSLQNEQLQGTLQELLRRFAKFQEIGQQLRNLSDRMVVAPDRYGRKVASYASTPSGRKGLAADNRSSGLLLGQGAFAQTEFDSLEMDSYGELHSLVQVTLEEMVQLEETVGDVVLLAGHSSESLEGQRQMLGHLRDDLMWARMLPLGEVLNRFPRMLRDLSRSYEKPVELKLSGTGVLVDKAALEKLYDPLLHLVRNAFDHGIEQPDVRLKQGKPEQGKIEIRAYHQGSQTIIEVRDDGRGLNLDRIRSKAIDMKLATPEQLAGASTSRLLELLFEPGFSTASQVSELSGRGVGLDVVRSQLRSLKGDVTVTSQPGHGTIFSLRIPLTLTLAKLLVGFVGATAFALPSDSIKEILIPQPNQVKQSGGQRFLHWQDRIVPAYHLSELLDYACPLPETIPSSALEVVPSPDDWAPPMLLLSQNDHILALEIDRLVTEQELVIKPFGAAIAPPSYIYGCTILGDGSLIPVINGAELLNSFMGQSKTATFTAILPEGQESAVEESSTSSNTPMPAKTAATPTVLVVDDSITLRQTLALTIQKVNYRVLQARDGREAVEQLQKNSTTIQLVVCDVEMPNMNGFEFLSHRRQDPAMSKIPTVMLTSRSSDKHRQLAMHLGANAYFTKPYIEQEFLAAIKDIITQGTPVKVPALAHSS